jgi:N-acetylmuramoyl-L-alanine amidase
MSKIYIDAGHGNQDPGAVGLNGRREADDNLRLATAVNQILLNLGFTTKMTRTANNFKSINRAVEANNWGADLLLSIHRNAFADPTAHGYETFTKVSFSAGDDRIAQAVHRRVVAAGVQRDRGVKRQNFGLLTSAKMPAILAEYNFVTNARDNELFDRNINAYAEATAQAIVEVYGRPATPPPTPTPNPTPAPSTSPASSGTIFRVQTGAFTQRANAERLVATLKSKGIDAFVATNANGVHRVQVGAFSVQANANAMLARLKNLGYNDAFIVRG